MSDARLILGDCLDVLRTLPAGSVDAVVTDPPYGQTNEAYDRVKGQAAFLPGLWAECLRVAKPNAALLAFGGSPTYHRLAGAVEAGGWRVRQMWGWVYRDGMITSAYPREGFDRLAPAMDPICFAICGKVLLRVEREGDAAWDRLTGRRDPYARCRLSERSGGHCKRQGVGRYPRTIMSDGTEPFVYFALPRAGRYRQSEHPNEKPLSLMERLVCLVCPPGGLVLDPFMGSGTTGVACVRTGRRFIGIEISPEYYQIAERRVADEQARTPLFPQADPA